MQIIPTPGPSPSRPNTPPPRPSCLQAFAHTSPSEGSPFPPTLQLGNSLLDLNPLPLPQPLEILPVYTITICLGSGG